MPISMPDEVAHFLSASQWHSLHIDRLHGDDQKLILRLLQATFADEDPKDISPEDVEEAVDHIRALANDLSQVVEESVDDHDLAAAGHAGDEVAEQMQGGEQR